MEMLMNKGNEREKKGFMMGINGHALRNIHQDQSARLK
jgi:hypothetical protein